MGVAALGWWGQRPLLRVLAEDDGAWGRWALQRLARLEDPDSFHLYVQALGSNLDHEGFVTLVFALAGKSDPEAEPDPEVVEAHQALLERYVEGEQDQQVRGGLYALFMLNHLGWTRTDALLEATAARLGDPEPTVRRYAALVLSKGGAPASTHDQLVRAFKHDDDVLVRRFALRALGEVGGDAAEEVIEAGLSDPDPDVFREAARIVREGSASLEDLLRVYAAEPEEARRAETLAALSKIEDPAVTALLVEAADGSAEELRVVAVRGLAEREGRGVVRALVGAIEDPVPDVRLTAVQSLGERAPERAVLEALVARLARHEGYGEIRQLHKSLKALSGAEVPAPTREVSSWSDTVQGWRAWLDASGS